MQKIIRNYFINDSLAITRTDQKNQECFEKECDILFKCFNSREYLPCFQRFANFLNSLLPIEYQYLLQSNDKFARALVSLRFFQGKFDDVCNLLQNHSFKDKTGLLKLWDTSHYRLREVGIGRPLNAVKRFRIRQSNPPPKGICVDGTRPTLKLPTRSLTILRRWFTAHIDSPYPTKEEKDNLSKETGLTLLQIKTWMSNTRRRQKQHPDEASGNKCGSVILANIQKMKYVVEQKEVEDEEESITGVNSITRRDANDIDNKLFSTFNPMDPENRLTSVPKSSVHNAVTSNQLKEEIVQSSESLGALQNICNNLKGK
ncbi:hypothetical protein SNE40_003207 [Patella caerulea]|uniref:Homeobox domain-containing protein n=1 Tax=Patella caerulea TaxID=87958 RepID=A0AAN8KHK1_PATCE